MPKTHLPPTQEQKDLPRHLRELRDADAAKNSSGTAKMVIGRSIITSTGARKCSNSAGHSVPSADLTRTENERIIIILPKPQKATGKSKKETSRRIGPASSDASSTPNDGDAYRDLDRTVQAFSCGALGLNGVPRQSSTPCCWTPGRPGWVWRAWACCGSRPC